MCKLALIGIVQNVSREYVQIDHKHIDINTNRTKHWCFQVSLCLM